MAERRMFAKAIIDSDAFLDMPISARLLYYDLSMRADDDGFVNSPKKIMKFVGATNDDMNILIARKFVILFENGVVVIKHWRIHNYIRKDTYKETQYIEEKACLQLDETNAYNLTDDVRQRSVDEPSTQVRLGKVRLGEIESEKTNKKENKKIFTKPTLEEASDFFLEIESTSDEAEAFCDYYESNGWRVGANAMKDWKAAARRWVKNNRNWSAKKQTTKAPDFLNPYKSEEKEIEVDW